MGNNKKNTFSAIIDNVKEYINLQAEYYKLSFAEKVSLLMARIILIVCIAILSLALLLLIFVLIYTLLMNWIGIPWIVVLIEIGILILAIIVTIVFRESLVIRPISNMMIRIILSKVESAEDEED